MRALSALLILVVTACSAPKDPSDDPLDWVVDPALTYEPVVSEPRWVVPQLIPAEARPSKASNNNVAIQHFGGRLYMAWRTSDLHFPLPDTFIHLASSADDGATWRFEKTFGMNHDLREPLFLSMNGELCFHFFQGSAVEFEFKALAQWRTCLARDGSWPEPERWASDGEITWDMKVRGGAAFRSFYTGTHYEANPELQLHFETSTDGKTWQPVSGDGVVYRGGVSEAAFEPDDEGVLWAVTRNEDGDASGFGSHVCSAPRGDWGTWECNAKCDPERYDSPKMFRHGRELYLVARRDVGGPFDLGREGITREEARLQYAAAYWGRPKRTALYRIDRAARKVVHVVDLPGAGDTALPSIVRTGAHTFLIANYTSRLTDPDRTWLQGQSSAEGTRIYLVTLELRAR
ncbi:MAG: hypothetical protein JNK82_10385 [Myxococcaceae bacterium]|nr:hypothetical protein [Myxococcaceae bacterium]